MQNLRLLPILAVLAMSSGCASISGSKTQALSVQTHEKGEQVINAKCVLTNDKGTWFVTTPGSVVVQKSYSDIAAKCEKSGMSPGVASFNSKANGGVWGNLLAGGVIGYAIDASNGSGFDYPQILTIEMGQTVMAPEKAKPTENSIPSAAIPGAQSCC